jgi:hypothetical protein
MSNNPEFIKCAMTAIEEGVRAKDIKEECACRLGISSLAAKKSIKQ